MKEFVHEQGPAKGKLFMACFLRGELMGAQSVGCKLPPWPSP